MTDNVKVTEEMIRAAIGWREVDENESITNPTASMVERILRAGLTAAPRYRRSELQGLIIEPREGDPNTLFTIHENGLATVLLNGYAIVPADKWLQQSNRKPLFQRLVEFFRRPRLNGQNAVISSAVIATHKGPQS